MNNSVFGKTMENIRKRCNVYLETHPEHFLRHLDQLLYLVKCLMKIYLQFNMKRQRLFLNKPPYVGMCILDLSKALKYDFHYNFIKKNLVIMQIVEN